MDAATHAHIEQRVHPVLSESFDGYVLVGYVTNNEGKRERVVTANGGNDAAIADALKPFIVQGMMWANVPRPQTTESPSSESRPE